MRAIKPHIRLLDLAQLSCAGCAQHGQCAAEESRATHRARARGARSRDAASAANTIMRIGRCDAATRAARARPAHRGEQRARMGSPARSIRPSGCVTTKLHETSVSAPDRRRCRRARPASASAHVGRQRRAPRVHRVCEVTSTAHKDQAGSPLRRFTLSTRLNREARGLVHRAGRGCRPEGIAVPHLRARHSVQSAALLHTRRVINTAIPHHSAPPGR